MVDYTAKAAPARFIFLFSALKIRFPTFIFYTKNNVFLRLLLEKQEGTTE